MSRNISLKTHMYTRYKHHTAYRQHLWNIGFYGMLRSADWYLPTFRKKLSVSCSRPKLLYSWRWDRRFPKKSVNTNKSCVTLRKTGDLFYTKPEAWMYAHTASVFTRRSSFCTSYEDYFRNAFWRTGTVRGIQGRISNNTLIINTSGNGFV